MTQSRSAAASPVAGSFIPQVTISAFAREETTFASFEAAALDRRLARASFTCHHGGIGAAISTYADHPVPDVLIVEVEPDLATFFAMLDQLASLTPPATLLVLIGPSNDVALYRKLKRLGISEYLVTPVTPLDVIEAIAALFDDQSAERKAVVTAFFGARGGCGASAVAQNVAWSLAHSYDTSALLIDLDLAAGTCALRLNLDATTSVKNALVEGVRLDKTVLDRMILRRDNKFALLPSPADLTDICAQDGADILRLIDLARTMTSHVVLDLPSGWSQYTERFLQVADQTVLVAAPDLVCLRNCGNIARKMHRSRPNDPPPRLVLAQVGLPRSRQIAPEHFAKSLDLAVSATIPFDAAIFSAAENEGRLVAQSAPTGSVAGQIHALAGLLIGQDSVRGVARGARRKRGLTRGLMGFFA